MFSIEWPSRNVYYLLLSQIYQAAQYSIIIFLSSYHKQSPKSLISNRVRQSKRVRSKYSCKSTGFKYTAWIYYCIQSQWVIVLSLSVVFSVFWLRTLLWKSPLYSLPKEVLLIDWKFAYYFIFHQGKLLFVIVFIVFHKKYDIFTDTHVIHESSYWIFLKWISTTIILIVPTIGKTDSTQCSIKRIPYLYRQWSLKNLINNVGVPYIVIKIRVLLWFDSFQV